MGAYLLDHPPRRSQYRRPRRQAPSGVIVVHTAENTPDAVALDGGAEAVAGFIRNRSDAGSYHDLADSDSSINLVPYDAEAFHDGTGSNPHSYGVSVATTAAWWPWAPRVWRDGAIRQAAGCAARYAGWLKATRGIVVPARRINRGESEHRVPGFISHAERDPSRRSDPGRAFPWDQFLAEFARLSGSGAGVPDQAPAPPPPPPHPQIGDPRMDGIWHGNVMHFFFVRPDGALVERWGEIRNPKGVTEVFPPGSCRTGAEARVKVIDPAPGTDVYGYGVGALDAEGDWVRYAFWAGDHWEKS
jgi:hypothetical protein